MTQQTIITTPANSMQGDSAKSAFDKCNANFTDLYAGAGFAGYARTAAEIAAGVTPTNYQYQQGNVLRYGADATGVASSYTAFVNAVAVCSGTGIAITVPAGQFNLPTSNAPIQAAYVTFQGTGVAKGTSIDAAGSVLNFTGNTTTNSAFSIGPGVTFDGIGFYYPSQVDSFTPIAFAPTIVTNLTNGAVNFVYIQNCVVWNAYRFFVDTDTTGSIGHVFLLDNTIYGILTCFELAYNAEIITIQGNEFTFGHYLVASEAGLRKYTRANGSVAVITRTDGIAFSGNVAYGYLNGLDFATVATLCQLTSICDNYFDQVLFPIIATGTGNISNFTISGNVITALNSQSTIPATVGNCINISTSGGLALEAIAISGNVFGTCNGDTILVSGASPRSISITGNSISGTGAYQTSGSFGCLNISGASTSYLASGNVMVNQASTAAVANGVLGSAVDAIINANQFGNFETAINATFNSVLASANMSYGTLGTYANNYSAGTTLDIGNQWDKDSLKVTGFGTPTGGTVVSNFPGASATLVQTSETVAEILTILKAKNIIAS